MTARDDEPDTTVPANDEAEPMTDPVDEPETALEPTADPVDPGPDGDPPPDGAPESEPEGAVEPESDSPADAEAAEPAADEAAAEPTIDDTAGPAPEVSPEPTPDEPTDPATDDGGESPLDEAADPVPAAGSTTSETPAPRPSVARSWRTLRRAFAPRATRPQVVVGLLCVLLGFALMVQVQANRDEGLSSLRQDELVRILDEVTQRHDELEEQAATLRAQRAELVTGTDTERAAQEAAQERARVQGILAGQLPVEGPGIGLTITARSEPISALVLYNVLEELRNAGAEAVQLNDLRLTASSYIVDVTGGVVVDGQSVSPPYRWLAIGDPDTIIPALNMPGGAMSAVRNATGEARLDGREHVAITATRSALAPRWATPAPEES